MYRDVPKIIIYCFMDKKTDPGVESVSSFTPIPQAQFIGQNDKCTSAKTMSLAEMLALEIQHATKRLADLQAAYALAAMHDEEEIRSLARGFASISRNYNL